MTIDSKRIIIIAPHPDDETLGCGGTLLKHKFDGDELYWLILTGIHEEHGWPKDRVEERQKEIDVVSDAYGFNKTYNLNIPTKSLDYSIMDKLISSISGVMNEVKPHTVYLPYFGDVHTDHSIASRAGLSCTKNFRFPFIKRVVMYETLSETEFSPPREIFCANLFVDITPFFEKKREIIKIYSTEIMEPYLPRSLETVQALARLRGSRIGVQYAEAFMLIEEIL